jgi:hypothetical protein
LAAAQGPAGKLPAPSLTTRLLMVWSFSFFLSFMMIYLGITNFSFKRFVIPYPYMVLLNSGELYQGKADWKCVFQVEIHVQTAHFQQTANQRRQSYPIPLF